ncbi:MAG: transposase [Saprospirales bacterium]|nr:transposase [Saprospirales bacterium]
MKSKDSSTNKQPRRRYDAEFKASALQMIENGRSVADVSRSLGVGEGVLHKWRRTVRQGPDPDQNAELEALRKQVKQLEMERDILKKALSIFSRTT